MSKCLRPVLFLLILCNMLSLSAQEVLPTGEVDVVKSFDARLENAERQLVRPQLPSLDSTIRRQNYNIQLRTLRVEYLPPKIRPLAFRTEKPEEGYNGFLRAGVGTPNAFLGEVSYDFVDSETFNLGVDLLRHSSNNNKTVENQKFSRNLFGADATYYAEDGYAVNADVGYTTRTLHYYGYNDLNEELDTNLYSFPNSEAVRQRFNMFEIGGKIFNGERTAADFNYSAGVDLYLLEDNYAARENGFNLNLEATKWFNGRHPLTLGLETDLTNYKDTAKQTLNNFYLTPSYTYHGDVVKIKLGANLGVNNDNFNFFPDVEVTATIAPGALDAFVGATGTLQKNTLRSLTDYNPFIRTRIRVRNSKFYHYYGGIKGNISGIAYRAQAGYKTVDNLPLYQLSDPLDSIPRFTVLYDTASIVTLKGSLSIPLTDDIQIEGTLSQNVYSLDREEKPWHLPALSINAAAIYHNSDNNLMIRGDLFLQNGVPYRSVDGAAENLNALFDISLMGEYYFTETIGAFLQLNNLANNKRQRWFRYPTYGLNILAGVNVRF